MYDFLLQLFNGLTYAGLLFVISSGFTLVFGFVRVVNMSHGTFYLLGAFIGWQIQNQTGIWLLAVFAGMVAVGITAILVLWLLQRVEGPLQQTVLTLGIAMLIGDLCLYIWGGLPRILNAPPILRKAVHMGWFAYPGFRLFVLLLAIIIGIGLWYMLTRTQLGRILRAGVDNREIVSTLGINVDRVFFVVFILTGLLTGLSGTIGGSYLAIGPGVDFKILTYALVVVIMGGMGSVTGAGLGALIVGLVDSFGRSMFNEVATFLLMGSLLVVLAFRPQGLMGREQ